jgi:CheY-like chemotaxis protein
LRAYLANSPYDVTFAEDGERAVQMALSQTFDLILMDVQMPVMDGLAATRLIQQEARSRGKPTVPVLALTANARSVDIDASIQAGCTAHLSKPILKQRLIGAIEKYLRKPEI